MIGIVHNRHHRMVVSGSGVTWNIKPPNSTIRICTTSITKATVKNKPQPLMLWNAECPLPNDLALTAQTQ